MHHSAVCVNTRCLRRSVRACGAPAAGECRAVCVTWDVIGWLHPVPGYFI